MKVEMSEEGKHNLAFQNHHKQLTAPYIIYADFEVLTTRIEGPQLNPTKNNTRKTNSTKQLLLYCGEGWRENIATRRIQRA